jgi:hypothetical protein
MVGMSTTGISLYVKAGLRVRKPAPRSIVVVRARKHCFPVVELPWRIQHMLTTVVDAIDTAERIVAIAETTVRVIV